MALQWPAETRFQPSRENSTAPADYRWATVRWPSHAYPWPAGVSARIDTAAWRRLIRAFPGWPDTGPTSHGSRTVPRKPRSPEFRPARGRRTPDSGTQTCRSETADPVQHVAGGYGDRFGFSLPRSVPG